MGILLNKKLANGFVATYARPIASPSLRFDSGYVEVSIALYKDAEARFDGAEPAGYETFGIRLTDAEREKITSVIYEALIREKKYEDGIPRDPDPEKQAGPIAGEPNAEEAQP